MCSDRPKLDAKRTFRLPKELDAYMQRLAADRRMTVNQLVLDSLEHEFARLLTYRLSLYAQLMPMGEEAQRRHCRTIEPALVG